MPKTILLVRQGVIIRSIISYVRAVGFLLLIVACQSRAVEIAYDSFEYPEGNLAGNSGGSGWRNAWYDVHPGGMPKSFVISPGQEYVDSNGLKLCTAGGRVGIAYDVLRYLNLDTVSRPELRAFVKEGRLGADSTTIWISFLAHSESGSAWSLVDLYAGEEERLPLGHAGRAANWGFVDNRGSREGKSPVSEDVFFVVRIDFKTANDDIYFWTNPDLDSEPAIEKADIKGSDSDASFDAVWIRGDAGDEMYVDELRIGTRWADVCKVQVWPEGKKTQSAEKNMEKVDEVQYGFNEDFAKIKEIISPPDEYNPAKKWYPAEGLLQSSRVNGFVRSEEYCKQNTPLLLSYLKHPDYKVRVAVAMRLAELRSPDGFEILLDALKKASPNKRGDDQWLFLRPGISERIIALIGKPDTYDPHGTKRLRDTVIERWRRRWKAEGKSFFQGLVKKEAATGKQALRLKDSTVTKNMTDMSEFFFLSGPKLYEIGAMDGTFPPLGWLLGDGGGIWAHPIKVMDGFRYKIREQGSQDWELTDCDNFLHEFSCAKFHYERNGLSITRKDFVVEDETGLFSVLSLKNTTHKQRTIHLEFAGLVNIRPAWRTGLKNDLDVIKYEDGFISAVDLGMEDKWAVVFGSDKSPVEHKLQDNSAVLTYSVVLPAGGSSDIKFLIAAEHEKGARIAEERFRSLLRQVKELWAEKERSYRETIFEGVQFSCSDESINQAFDCAKANLKMMTADFRPYFVGRYFLTGIPEYLQLFGSDTLYSIAGAAAAGFGQTARDNLCSLADLTKQQSGRVPHEAVTNGKILSRGNVQETPQFVVGCWKYLQWSGDQEFLKEVFGLCEQSVEYVTKNNDRDGDLYPEGYGLMEVAGMNQENLDAACYLYSALKALAEMARQMGQDEKVDKYSQMASDLKRRFNKDFWNDESGMWADAIGADGAKQMRGQWGVSFPMEVRIAEADKAGTALKKIEERWVNKWDMSERANPDFRTCPWSNNVLALAAYNYGQSDLGWDRLKLTSRVPLEFGMLGAFENVVPTADDIFLIQSSATFLQAIIEGLCGIEPGASAHTVEIFPQPPKCMTYFGVRDLQIGEHKIDISWKEREDRKVVTIVHKQGPCALDIILRVESDAARHITVDEQICIPEQSVVRGIMTKEVGICLDKNKSTVISTK